MPLLFHTYTLPNSITNVSYRALILCIFCQSLLEPLYYTLYYHPLLQLLLELLELLLLLLLLSDDHAFQPQLLPLLLDDDLLPDLPLFPDDDHDEPLLARPQLSHESRE